MAKNWTKWIASCAPASVACSLLFVWGLQIALCQPALAGDPVRTPEEIVKFLVVESNVRPDQYDQTFSDEWLMIGPIEKRMIVDCIELSMRRLDQEFHVLPSPRYMSDGAYVGSKFSENRFEGLRYDLEGILDSIESGERWSETRNGRFQSRFVESNMRDDRSFVLLYERDQKRTADWIKCGSH